MDAGSELERLKAENAKLRTDIEVLLSDRKSKEEAVFEATNAKVVELRTKQQRIETLEKQNRELHEQVLSLMRDKQSLQRSNCDQTQELERTKKRLREQEDANQAQEANFNAMIASMVPDTSAPLVNDTALEAALDAILGAAGPQPGSSRDL